MDDAARGRRSAWKLEDAKARFSELVRRARSEGPQRVTCRGKDAVVVIAAEDFARFETDERTGADLAAFLQQTALGELELIREEDRGPLRDYAPGRGRQSPALDHRSVGIQSPHQRANAG
jgi:prevent-host-death family protein